MAHISSICQACVRWAAGTCTAIEPRSVQGKNHKGSFFRRVGWAPRKAGHDHAKAIWPLVRPMAERRIAWHKERGHRLVLVSASLDLYLEPITRELGFDDLLCTRLSKNHGVFDGNLDGKNCRAQKRWPSSMIFWATCRHSNCMSTETRQATRKC